MNLQHQIQCWPHELQDPHLLTSVEPAKVKITDFKDMQERRLIFIDFSLLKIKLPNSLFFIHVKVNINKQIGQRYLK